MSWIEQAFGSLPDPRTGNAKRHDLLELLTIALTASVCGAETCSDFADFAVDREPLFREFLRVRPRSFCFLTEPSEHEPD